jgi:hypothetical protein
MRGEFDEGRDKIRSKRVRREKAGGMCKGVKRGEKG